ncbi:hypothetical protein [Erythrobacter neustonensis]|uniref:Peptidase inhibitor I78 n=1 Tax=Erythrobacter neustonensis TaxID=1112 RepID=A0A192D632_9SPHN|nr:hypothetical protein [Erythrobacter neustonensis]ANK13481.1 hypothetical protein A9D12_11655 [Erythrobacter neustonensis]
MIRAAGLCLSLAALALTACDSAPATPGNDADSFAQRIGQPGTAPAASSPVANATNAPQVAAPLPGAAPGAFARGTLTDPAAANCGAPLMAPFIGRPADQPTRAEIAGALGRTDNLRFVAFGSTATVNPDPTNPRLSIMLDGQNIIRDARCG